MNDNSFNNIKLKSDDKHKLIKLLKIDNKSRDHATIIQTIIKNIPEINFFSDLFQE